MTRPTLVSLAAELGVSRQTVSNVINAPHMVKPATRERVLAAIEASGYRPNVAAQALRNQRSRSIAFRLGETLDGGINGALTDRFLHALARCLQARNYSLVLVTASTSRDEVATLREMHLRGTIDGCVLTDTDIGDDRPSQLADARLPFVTFGRPWGREDSAHDWVDVDGAAGTRLATEHLLRRGLDRIGFLGWPPGSAAGDDRRRGWELAMLEAGHADLVDFQASCEDRMVAGLEAVAPLLDRGIQGVVCASDSLAVGALEAMRRRGLTAQDAPVIGFDNTPVARAIGLSSINQPVEQAADELAALLEDRLSDATETSRPATHRLLQPELQLRSTSALYEP